MKITSIKYDQFKGEPAEWQLDRTDFGDINLLVGKNASGKSRAMNVIVSLSRLLSSEVRPMFISGTYFATFSDKDSSFSYEIAIRKNKVAFELFKRNDEILLSREESGKCSIRAEQLNTTIDSQIPTDIVAAYSRRDAIQHPFLDHLFLWASTLKYFPFGTSMGKDHFLTIGTFESIVTSSSSNGSGASDEVTVDRLAAHDVSQLYARAYGFYGDEFDKQILKGLCNLGYDCTDIRLANADAVLFPGAGGLTALYLTEKNVSAAVSQFDMSQGMFRALSLIIHINVILFQRKSRTVIIDDIGEGLDFSRSKQFISLLIDRSQAAEIQLIMTTNDRFIMNGVSLEYWSVLSRHGSSVKTINKKNSPQVFSDFDDLGLNNFDFFSNNFFDEEYKEQITA